MMRAQHQAKSDVRLRAICAQRLLHEGLRGGGDVCSKIPLKADRDTSAITNPPDHALKANRGVLDGCYGRVRHLRSED